MAGRVDRGDVGQRAERPVDPGFLEIALDVLADDPGRLFLARASQGEDDEIGKDIGEVGGPALDAGFRDSRSDPLLKLLPDTIQGVRQSNGVRSGQR